MSEGRRRKVAVLGGGVGAVTAAFALTSTPALRDRYEVTVYQAGWRLGGKGASGRNAAAGQRIEEHGLHIWFGFYDNAFRLLRQCYEELGRPATAPLSSLETAFIPHDDVVLFDRDGDHWVPWHQHVPPNPFPVGEDHELPTLWDAVRGFVAWAERGWGEHGDRDGGGGAEAVGPHHHFGLVERMAKELSGAAHHEHPHLRAALARLLTDLRDAVRRHAEARMATDPHLRMYIGGFDLFATVLIGILDDDLVERGFGAVDDEELTAWLARHGALPSTAGPTFAGCSAVLRALYDMVFAFEGGDLDRPNLAAGTAVHGLLRMAFTYKGHLYWKMQAGMGDTIFMPYFQALAARGVRFEFFSWVDRLCLDAGHELIEAIDVIPQVVVTGGAYDPVLEVNGLPCWPSSPRWEQIEGGEELAAKGVDLEKDANPRGVGAQTLRRGVDFDDVVLGISVGALPAICAELIADDGNPAFGAMLDATPTVATQAFQLWMSESVEELGWVGAAGAISGAYVEPLDTYCDMSHLLDRETWTPADGVRSIAYFCGVQRDGPGDDWRAAQASADERAKAAALDYLRCDVPSIWPDAVLSPEKPAVDWELLVDPAGRAGPDRFDAQYWRGNCLGTERYVLSPAGRIRHRLRADASGYANLFLAGDWTATGLDLGCVEAATMSGLQAARALSGEPFPIVGEDHRWLTGSSET